MFTCSVRRFLVPVLTATAVSLFAACGASSSKSEGTLLSAQSSDPRFDSTWLIQQGERSKSFWMQEFTRRSAAAQQSTGFRFVIMDARDPRLYPPGAPIQPPTPADKAIVKFAPNGAWVITALFIDRPGYFLLKEFPTGNRVIEIQWGEERLAWESRWHGLFASVSRFTSGNGWEYLWYLRGRGNQVWPAEVESAVAEFLSRSVIHVTPL